LFHGRDEKKALVLQIMSLRKILVEKRFGVSLDQVVQQPSLQFFLYRFSVQSHDDKKSLWMHGTERKTGFSVTLRIEDFEPSFYVRAPNRWPQDEEVAEEELAEFLEKMNQQLDGKIKCGEFDYMTPFIGFTNNRKDRMIRVVCDNINDYALVKNHFKKANFTMYHEDFDFGNQFMQQTGVKYMQLLEVKNIRYHRSPLTFANIEGSIEEKNLSLVDNAEGATPIFLKCFLRIKAVSKDGIVKKMYRYHPDSTLEQDRVVGIGMCYTWSDQNEPCYEHVCTTIPKEEVSLCQKFKEHPNCTVTHWGHEVDLLAQFQKQIIMFDPDALFYFPDYHNTLVYILNRSLHLNYDTTSMCEQFKGRRMNTMKQNEFFRIARWDSRSLLDMEAALKKKVFIQVESYDLYTVSAHKAFRKNRISLSDANVLKDPHYVNFWYQMGPTHRHKVIDMLLQDMSLLQSLENDTGMLMEFATISQVSDTDITTTVASGEQIRVYNKLCHFCIDNDTYVNRERTSEKPLHFSIRDKPPTYKDPIELELNTALRKKSLQALYKKQAIAEQYSQTRKTKSKSKKKKDQAEYAEKVQNIMSSMMEAMEAEHADDEDDAEEKPQHHFEEMIDVDSEEKEGGNVMHPTCGFYKNQRISIFDFKSLYPSIMMAYNVCYKNLVFDKKYLNLPGVDYIYVQINKFETVALAVQEGLIPKLLRLLVDTRDSIKAKMKKETDKFRYSILDKEQNSMKVLCNATYGFCGAGSDKAILAIKDIMYIVTSLGRYLQKDTADYLGKDYKVPSVYGDSVTGETPLLMKHDGKILVMTMDQLWARLDLNISKDPGKEKQHIEVNGWFTWTEQGWTPVERMMRHRTDKEIFRVRTWNSLVDVTADHSLIDHKGQAVKPGQVNKTTILLQHLPHTSAFPGFKEGDEKSSYEQGKQYGLNKILPVTLLNASMNERVALWKGLGTTNLFCHFQKYNFVTNPLEKQEQALRIYLLAHSLGFKTLKIAPTTSGKFQVFGQAETTTTPDFDAGVMDVTSLGHTKDFVYDLTTGNHHFHAGAGSLIVHNTDSVFVYVEHHEAKTIEEMCLETGKRYKMDYWAETAYRKPSLHHGKIGLDPDTLKKPRIIPFLGEGKLFTWDNVVEYWSKRKLDITKFELEHQINAFMYIVYDKLNEEVTRRFPYPIILEFENMADRVWMGWVKKHYCYRLWNPKNPSEIEKIKVTGMPVKKREWAPWTREILEKVTHYILYDDLEKIQPDIEEHLKNLISGEVPLDKLKISKNYKGKLAYKSMRQIHLQVVLRKEDRERWPVKDRTRVYFAVIKGQQKQFMRGETPEYIEENKVELDYMYYLQRQFYLPMKKLLTYHPELFDFDALFADYMRKLELKEKNLVDISECLKGDKGIQIMSYDEMIKKRKKDTNSLTNPNKRKKVMTHNIKLDPFASMMACQ